MLVKKITAGFVIQTFDTTTMKWVSQEFVAGDECDIENDKGEPLINTAAFSVVCDEYLCFDMVQPNDHVIRE
jgi:hypothetical protein